jgi:protease-4
VILNSKTWILIFIVAVVIAGAISFLILMSFGAFLPDRQTLAFGDKVGVIEIQGTMITGTTAVDEIRQFAKDDGIRAIVLRIESPGGVVAAAQEIYDELNKVRRRGKPIVASMGGIAASGGYYVACGADSIVANPGTLTGSIGVIMSLPNAEELLKKIGLRYEVIKTGKYKDTGSLSRPMTPEERALLQEMLDDVHDQFVTVVAEERNIEKDAVMEFADGRLMSGRQAFEMGLVDRLGGFRDAVLLAADLAGIEGDPVIVRPRRKAISLWDVLEDIFGMASKLGREGASLQYSFR